MASVNKKDLVKLDVRVIGNLFWKDGFGIFEVEMLDSKADHAEAWIAATETTFIKGNFDRKFQYGEEYVMYGSQVNHPKYGLQYDVKIVQAKFDTPQNIKTFLCSLVSSSIADQLLRKYEGKDLMQLVIDNKVDYSDINGMGKVRFDGLREKVIENESLKDLIIELSQYGITLNQMKKLVGKFGARALSTVLDNPYSLCQIYGIGFMKADEIAKSMGFATDSEFRIREAIRYILNEAQKEGHSWLSTKEVLSKGMELLSLRSSFIEPEIENIEDVVIIGGDRVAMLNVYNAEIYVAERLSAMNATVNKLLRNFDMGKFIKEQELYNSPDSGSLLLPNGFTEEQKAFFYNIQQNGVNFLVGYAGCGKSFLLQFLVKILNQLHLTYLLCAPTGKAAKVIEQYTGIKASTVHRAFGLGIKNESDPEAATKGVYDDVVIYDEASMLGIITFAMSLKGIMNPNAMVLLIGDDFQLPSVEVGNLLHDSIKSGVFQVTKLTKVFRQQEGGILDTATKVRLGVQFVERGFLDKREYGKDMLLHCCDPEFTAKGAIYYYKQALKKGYTPDDIIVLTPTKKGPKGTRALNNAIQAIVNPPDDYKAEIPFGKEMIFREGDQVINTQNNYKAINISGGDTVIFNGDMGRIDKIDKTERNVIIDYGGDTGKVVTPFDSMGTIIHSYALTIHKSQGSGFKVVIMLVDYSHQFQLNANLIYTAQTRSKEYLYLLGQADIINRSMKKNVSLERNSFLKDFLVTESDKLKKVS